MTYEEYADWLSESASSDGEFGTASRIPRQLIFDMGNGQVAYAERLMFHWALKTSDIGDTEMYDRRYCYEGGSPIRVMKALLEWQERDWKGEPTGWRRDPNTGRRRNDDGDPATEYVEA